MVTSEPLLPLRSPGTQGPSAADCIGRCANVRFQGVCVPVCPPGSFESSSGTDCLECDDGCSAASGCFGPGPHECIECAEDSFAIVSNNFTRVSCVAACPDGMYPDEARQCQPCHPECDLCYGPSATECTHCRNFAYYPASGAPQCRSRCPVEISFESDLGGVPTRGDTTASRVATTMSDSSTTTAATTDTDDDCGSACDESSGMGEEEEGAGSTVAPTLAPKEPQEFDPSGGFVYTPRDARAVDATFACLPCHPQCSAAGCNGVSNADCNACQNVEYRGLCLSSCPDFTYRTADDRCFDCDEQCVEGCTGPGPAQCNTCRGVRFEGTCVARCPATAYITNGECLACAAECSAAEPGCDGPSPFDCNACADFEVAATGQCVSACPVGMYPAPGRTCEPCHPLCEQCTGPNSDQCLGCRGVEFDHFCLEECPPGYFRNSEAVCVQCDFECKCERGRGRGRGRGACVEGGEVPVCTRESVL